MCYTISDNSNSRCGDRKTAYMMVEWECSHMPIFLQNRGERSLREAPTKTDRQLSSSKRVLNIRYFHNYKLSLMAFIHWEDVTQPSNYASSEADGCVIFLSLSVFLRLGLYSHNYLNTLKLNKAKSKIESESWISISVNAHIVYCICPCWLNLV